MSSDVRFPIPCRELLQRLEQAFQVRMVLKDRDSRVIDYNQAYAEDTGGASPQDLIGKTERELPWTQDTLESHLQADRQVLGTGETLIRCEQERLAKDGQGRWILRSTSPVRGEDGRISGLLELYQDVTAFKRLESEMSRVDRAYRLLRDANHTIMTLNSESGLFQEICKLVVDHGYKMCWVGELLQDEQKSIRPLSSAGFVDGYLDSIRVTWADEPHGRGPTGTAAREDRTVVNQNVLINPLMQPWREVAVRHGFQSSIAMPLRTAEGRVFAVLTLYAAEPNAFDEEEAAKLEELAQALSFGLEAIRERQKRFDVLEKSVSALAATVESRDPYTAGHQSRVAGLAESMAREMGLDAESCVGIRLAALIHDIGKMQIPTEILTKPTRLNALEMAMIRTHPVVGYEILRDIPFPWPVAEMVLQHHERFDGSGYPKGLKGEEILLGARILSVADVVEAISADRPYRAALGMQAALDVIAQGRGILFDPQVVDACLRMFAFKTQDAS